MKTGGVKWLLPVIFHRFIVALRHRKHFTLSKNRSRNHRALSTYSTTRLQALVRISIGYLTRYFLFVEAVSSEPASLYDFTHINTHSYIFGEFLIFRIFAISRFHPWKCVSTRMKIHSRGVRHPSSTRDRFLNFPVASFFSDHYPRHRRAKSKHHGRFLRVETKRSRVSRRTSRERERENEAVVEIRRFNRVYRGFDYGLTSASHFRLPRHGGKRDS